MLICRNCTGVVDFYIDSDEKMHHFVRQLCETIVFYLERVNKWL